MTRGTATPGYGALVISLDFELRWGVRERTARGDSYVPNLHGARTVIPRLLDLFEEFGIAATWATVGFLFARSRDELRRYTPIVRPAYHDLALSPFCDVLGRSEEDDPLHFASSLIRRIQRTAGQELATHTFSHYYCNEGGQTREAFRADLEAACAIATSYGVRLRSIVFPRNQHNPAYDDILVDAGIRSYRGNPASGLWRFGTAEESGALWRRLGRGCDAYLGLAEGGGIEWASIVEVSGLTNVRASSFLAPYRPALRHLERLRLRRLTRSLRAAAQSRRIVHLWWHPHNFGIHQNENLAFLRAVLVEFAACRDRYGMRSLSMSDADGVARDLAAVDPPTRLLVGAGDTR